MRERENERVQLRHYHDNHHCNKFSAFFPNILEIVVVVLALYSSKIKIENEYFHHFGN